MRLPRLYFYLKGNPVVIAKGLIIFLEQMSPQCVGGHRDLLKRLFRVCLFLPDLVSIFLLRKVSWILIWNAWILSLRCCEALPIAFKRGYIWRYYFLPYLSLLIYFKKSLYSKIVWSLFFLWPQTVQNFNLLSKTKKWQFFSRNLAIMLKRDVGFFTSLIHWKEHYI